MHPPPPVLSCIPVTYYLSSRTDVCEDAEKLNDPARGMLTPTIKLLNDHEFFDEFKYYRFMNGVGKITNFPIKGIKTCATTLLGFRAV